VARGRMSWHFGCRVHLHEGYLWNNRAYHSFPSQPDWTSFFTHRANYHKLQTTQIRARRGWTDLNTCQRSKRNWGRHGHH